MRGGVCHNVTKDLYDLENSKLRDPEKLLTMPDPATSCSGEIISNVICILEMREVFLSSFEE